MKLKTTLAVSLGVGLSPTLAFCAEAGAEGGSWLALLFYVINFAIFVFILVRYAGPIAVRFFRDRAAQIRDNLTRSESGLSAATESARAAEALLAGLQSEKARLLKEMSDETEREVRRIGELGQAAASRIRQDGELTARSIADTGRRTLRAELAAIATRIARQLISKNFERQDQARLLGEFLETVGREVHL